MEASIETRTNAFFELGDSAYKYPKSKERFVPLQKWKEEALQYVAQSRGTKASAAVGEPETLNKEKTELDVALSTDSSNSAATTLEPSSIGDNSSDAPRDTEIPTEAVPTEGQDTSTDIAKNASEATNATLKENSADISSGSADSAAQEVPKVVEEISSASEAVAVNHTDANPKRASDRKLEEGVRFGSEFASHKTESTVLTNASESSPTAPEVPQTSSKHPSADAPTSTPNPESSKDASENVSSSAPKPNSTAPLSDSPKNTTNHSSMAHPPNQTTSTGSATSAQETAPAAPIAPNIPSTPSQPMQKPSKNRRLRKNRINYAQHDCGAKVLAANPEAVDPSAVLVGSKDRYMLNPCSAPRQFIVVELCESVGVDHIQIGNFEFFSSMIKDVQVLASNRYPTTSWAVLGNFTLANERELQSLDFGEESELHPEWFKYLQIRILSHWGNEYYCPITEIQVHGLPYVEKLQRELQQSTQTAKDVNARYVAPEGIFGVDGSDDLFEGPVVDSVIPMAEYLAQHALEATEHFNSIYNTSMVEIPTPQALPATTSRDSEDGRPYDVVHQPVPSPPQKVGGDDDIDEIDDANAENGDSERGGASSESEKAKANLGASAIPTMNLIQMIVQRVKKIEVDQSLLTAYLANVSALHQGELNELGEALAELNQHYKFLNGFIADKSRTQEILEAKVSALTENLHTLQEQVDTLPRTFRIYLAISALVALAICITLLFTVVIIFRCLPMNNNSSMGLDVLGRSTSSGSLHGLLRSNSDIRLDILRRSGSMGALKTDENFSLMMPPPTSTTPTLPQSDHVVTMSTPPPPSHALAGESSTQSSDTVSISSDDSILSNQYPLIPAHADHPYSQMKLEHQAELEATSSDLKPATSIAVRDVLSSHVRRHSEPNTIRSSQ